MTQQDLNRAIARATGESVSEIERRGFGPLDDSRVYDDPEDLIIDWDELPLSRSVAQVLSRCAPAA